MDTEEPVPMPHDSPLHSVHSLGRDEGSMQQTKLTVLVTKLTERVDSLESQLQQTKQTYSTALTKMMSKLRRNMGGI
ncbi:hypothetical protein Tco_1232587 [Tanacetum coccineum]